MTTGSSPRNLDGVDATLVIGDVADPVVCHEALGRAGGACVAAHFAAVSHVDRSIADGRPAWRSNALGTSTLARAARAAGARRFLHVSTDEVYGPVEPGAVPLHESAPFRPSSPYAATKAIAELLLAFPASEGLDVVVARPCNVYGPRQHPEKLLPTLARAAWAGQRLPLYGDGLQVRDWLHVDDATAALIAILEHGDRGTAYNVPGGQERTNRWVAEQVLDLAVGGTRGSGIEHVADRPGHDRRYAMDGARVRALGWHPARRMAKELPAVIEWYRDHPGWWSPIA
jgi:dTDP-glucose 4,6-dehydratase